jgi:hemerythrin
MALTWNLSLATGIRQIDLQHQELIDIINDLEAAHLAGKQEQAVEEVLPQLAAYALFHFGTEEAMMKKSPKCSGHAEQHLNQHRLFAEKIAAYRARPLSPPELAELVAYLNTWLVEHIMKTDREMADLLPGERVA